MRNRNSSGTVQRTLALWLMGMAVVLVLLGACLTGSAPGAATESGRSITLDALPNGVGRGFPTVRIDAAASQGVSVRQGEEPPNFQFVLEDGRSLSLHELRGQPVLLNFWASWCGPCRLEMPDIVKVATTNPDLVVLAINVQESLEQIQPFAEEFQMTLPIVRDTDGKLRNLYEVRGMPTSVFIDRQGTIFTIWPGMLTADLLQEIVSDLD